MTCFSLRRLLPGPVYTQDRLLSLNSMLGTDLSNAHSLFVKTQAIKLILIVILSSRLDHKQRGYVTLVLPVYTFQFTIFKEFAIVCSTQCSAPSIQYKAWESHGGAWPCGCVSGVIHIYLRLRVAQHGLQHGDPLAVLQGVERAVVLHGGLVLLPAGVGHLLHQVRLHLAATPRPPSSEHTEKNTGLFFKHLT